MREFFTCPLFIFPYNVQSLSPYNLTENGSQYGSGSQVLSESQARNVCQYPDNDSAVLVEVSRDSVLGLH